MSTSLKVAAVQMSSGADPGLNYTMLAAYVSEAAQQGARLVLLPENALFMGRNERDKLGIAEAYQRGPWQQALAALAKDAGVYLVCGSFPLQVPDDAEHIFPSTLVWGPSGAMLARYDKLHLFDVDLPDGKSYRESRYFQAGTQPPQHFECDGLRVGLSICYDLRFPELYRALMVQGARLLLVPAAFTAATGQAHWHPLLQARAIENLAFVLAANQCGTHPGGQSTWGHSMILDPWGRTLASADDAPGVICAELDLEGQVRLQREFPVLQHRRLSSTASDRALVGHLAEPRN